MDPTSSTVHRVEVQQAPVKAEAEKKQSGWMGWMASKAASAGVNTFAVGCGYVASEVTKVGLPAVFMNQAVKHYGVMGALIYGPLLVKTAGPVVIPVVASGAAALTALAVREGFFFAAKVAGPVASMTYAAGVTAGSMAYAAGATAGSAVNSALQSAASSVFAALNADAEVAKEQGPANEGGEDVFFASALGEGIDVPCSLENPAVVASVTRVAVAVLPTPVAEEEQKEDGFFDSVLNQSFNGSSIEEIFPSTVPDIIEMHENLAKQ